MQGQDFTVIVGELTGKSTIWGRVIPTSEGTHTEARS